MSIKTLSARVAQLERQLLPDTSEPTVLHIDFISGEKGKKGEVVDQLEVSLPSVKVKRSWRSRHRFVWRRPANQPD